MVPGNVLKLFHGGIRATMLSPANPYIHGRLTYLIDIAHTRNSKYTSSNRMNLCEKQKLFKAKSHYSIDIHVHIFIIVNMVIILIVICIDVIYY